MTNNSNPPTSDDEFIKPAGNWTNGTDPNKDGISEFGTFVLSRERFLEQWFVPKLKKLNRMMSASYVKPSMSFDANLIKWWASFKFPVLVGDGCQGYSIPDKKDDDYSMAYSSSQPDGLKKLVQEVSGIHDKPLSDLPEGALCWYYWATPLNWTQHDSAYLSKCDSYARSIGCSRLSIVPGKNIMTLEGFTMMKFGFYINPSPLDPNVDSTNLFLCTWKVQFQMTEVTDGGLAIKINDPEIQYNWNKWVTDWTISGTDKYYDVKGDTNEAFDTAKRNLDNLVHGFRNALEGNEKFYFPSRGRFYFKDAQFGHEGDLVVKCAYNGNETGEANPVTSKKRDLSNPPGFEIIHKIPFGSEMGQKKKQKIVPSLQLERSSKDNIEYGEEQGNQG